MEPPSPGVPVAAELTLPGAWSALTATGWREPGEDGVVASAVGAVHGKNYICAVCGINTHLHYDTLPGGLSSRLEAPSRELYFRSPAPLRWDSVRCTLDM